MQSSHKIYILILTLLVFGIGSYLSYLVSSTNLRGAKENKQDLEEFVLASSINHAEAAQAFSELKKYPFYSPTLLSFEINEFKNSINIEHVGLETDGQLQAPESWENAGWYAASAKPGQQGLVVMDGHYDTDKGQPAAFWGLKNIKLNDKVVLQDEMGKDFSYTVVDIFYVDIQDPQRNRIFQESDKVELILITCGGVWDSVENTYNKRLVIKAELL